jgi:ketosteroid isomerase-like protein
MSEENVEIVRGVRTPINVPRETKRRTLDERLFVRFPALAHALLSAWSRLPPSSRLRRAIAARLVRQAAAAANRRDFEVLLLALDPEFEMSFDESAVGGFVPPDLVGLHRGHEDFLRVWEAGIEAIDLKIDYAEVIDYGDRLLLCGRQTGRGRTSGIPVDQPLFQVMTVRHGLVIREEDFTERQRALEAAGLSE